MIRSAGKFDVIVIGAGHAGVEAALAAARMGAKTIMFSINLDSVAMMPCNPSIGGTGKGHLVREIDALGGEMGLNIDRSMIQCKMLNKTKGPAVHSLRAQADKNKYHSEMKRVIENTDNLFLRQAEVTDIVIENKQVLGIKTSTGSFFEGKTVVLASGTYLGGKVFIGNSVFSSGPNGLAPANKLTESLLENEISIRRFKTGTPARINKRTINFEKMIEQYGDSDIEPFSFLTEKIDIEQELCWLSYTNTSTHNIINQNIHLSAMFSGNIEGVGPRYCPSIEDKIYRFADKDRHQLFIEPEGLDTNEMYVQGMSTSLPEEIQIEFMKSIPGLEDVEMMRPAYAIEYDCIDPLQLNLSLEFKDINGLFSAGQSNGSSGYEEAAAQGLIAGINAVQKIKNEEPLILDRSEAYIGVLIDDLVTKGTDEPYRMMTSRSEYRLILRQDNADIRLTRKGFALGLASALRLEKLEEKEKSMVLEMERLKETKIRAEFINPVLEKLNSTVVKDSMTMLDLLKRPELNYENLAAIDIDRPELNRDVMKECEIQIKYTGYISKQLAQINKFKALENKYLPQNIDYSQIDGLRLEARQKLNDIKPLSIGQASRISGVSPADISVLMVYIEQMRRTNSNV
ncbi:MAG: tRNA uridine-5-carboxymethylaminomethyl(34) synthesis enzyme MnmG [Clostridiales bacterium]|nr:tRNA uridine-5-carboxymethylaminomethyl(34) synthesis enzyme MnmG [Clostridiales bacterium]